MEGKIYTTKDLEKVLPFGRNKILQLCQVGAIPVVKIGRSYITTGELLNEWVKENVGNDIPF